MATVIDTIEVSENTSAHDSPRLVAGKNGGTLRPFTPETSRLASQKRIEKKRALIRSAAQSAVESGSLKQQYKGWAWLAEVAQTQMRIATTPEAGKSAVMAASWLVDNAGLSEKANVGSEGAGAQVLDAVADVMREIAAAARRQRERTDVIDIRSDSEPDVG